MSIYCGARDKLMWGCACVNAKVDDARFGRSQKCGDRVFNYGTTLSGWGRQKGIIDQFIAIIVF